MQEKVFEILVGNVKEGDPVGRPRIRLECGIVDLKKVGGMWSGLIWLRVGISCCRVSTF